MTQEERLKLSGEVVAKLWPEWWTAQPCDGLGGVIGPGIWHCSRHGLPMPHDIPPPDLTEPTNFLRALKLIGALVSGSPHFDRDHKWYAHIYTTRGPWADTPEEALLLALADYVRRLP